LSFTETIQQFAEAPITKQLLLANLKEYSRPFDKINELVKQGFLQPVKRGIFVPGTKLKMVQPEPFLLANHMHGPSYVSLESALSYWGLIPERVYETTSVTTTTSKKYNTPIGRFSFMRMPLPYYCFGVQQVELTPKQHVIMASPEKAVCDQIIATSGIFLRSKKQTAAYLLEDMRMDEGLLRQMNLQNISEWMEVAPKSSSIEMLVRTLETL
jgi:hypothetical protein